MDIKFSIQFNISFDLKISNVKILNLLANLATILQLFK